MKPVVQESTLVQQRAQGLALISPLKSKVTAIVINNADDYALADETLSQIMQAKTAWLGRLNPIIEPIKAGLDLLYGLRRDILSPLEQLEGMVKERMRAYKLEESKQLQLAQEAKKAEETKIKAELEAKEKAEARAKTAPMLNKILEQKARLQQALADKQAQTIEPTRAANSSARSRKTWKVTNKGLFIKYLVAHPELLSLVQIDSVQMNALYRVHKSEGLAPEKGEWLPGISIEEDISIAGHK